MNYSVRNNDRPPALGGQKFVWADRSGIYFSTPSFTSRGLADNQLIPALQLQ